MRYLLVIFLCISNYVVAQPPALTLEKAQELAAKNYPLVLQRNLIDQTAALTVGNIQKGFLPQLSVNGQATYQSDVTSIPVKLPNINIETPAKDQYRLLTDVNQLIYDGGAIRQQKQVQQLNALVETQKIEVELQKLREKINDLYLNVLLVDEQAKLVAIGDSDLYAGIKRVNAQVVNGTALRSNLAVLQAELLKNEQRRSELAYTRGGLLDVLSLFMNEQVAHDVQLVNPPVSVNMTGPLTRSELGLFSLQDSLLHIQAEAINIRNKPRLSLFAQAGYGRPGLNLLQNNFQLFGMGGVRFNWNLGNLYTRKNEHQLSEISRRNVAIQRDHFLLGVNSVLVREKSNMDKLQKLIDTDMAIIALREQVAVAAKAQLENGVLLAGDYIREIDAADAARQNLALHRLQLLQSQLNYQTLSGK